MREGVSVHETHVNNTASLSLSEVMDENVSLLIQVLFSLWYIFGKVFHSLIVSLSHEGVVAHV